MDDIKGKGIVVNKMMPLRKLYKDLVTRRIHDKSDTEKGVQELYASQQNDGAVVLFYLGNKPFPDTLRHLREFLTKGEDRTFADSTISFVLDSFCDFPHQEYFSNWLEDEKSVIHIMLRQHSHDNNIELEVAFGTDNGVNRMAEFYKPTVS